MCGLKLQDGTTNFVHRQPYVCVSIALAVNRQVRWAGALKVCGRNTTSIVVPPNPLQTMN